MCYWQFSKNFTFPKNGSHFEYSNFLPKIEKQKFPSIFLTMQDRVILSKFSTYRVSTQGTFGNFQKILLSPKMAAILNFLPKIEKQKFPSIFLTMQDRVILSKFSTHRVSTQCTFGNFQKILLSPKMAAILNF